MRNVHKAHSGIEACLRLAREHVYWPGMCAQIKDLVQRCETCCSLARAQQKEPMASFDEATRPWQIVGSNICHFENRDYLVTVDFFSNFWEVDRLEQLTSECITRKIKIHFARYGVPERLRPDNGPQFSSQAFRNFSEKWRFEHATSSPRYPQSNGGSKMQWRLWKHWWQELSIRTQIHGWLHSCGVILQVRV